MVLNLEKINELEKKYKRESDDIALSSLQNMVSIVSNWQGNKLELIGTVAYQTLVHLDCLKDVNGFPEPKQLNS